MKKLLNIPFFIVCFSVIIASCEKKAEKIADFTMSTSSETQLKINYNSSYTANPGIQLKLNDVRVSGLITTRTPFPGGGYNTNGDSRPDYLEVKPGVTKLTVSIPKKNTATDSVLLYSTTFNLEANKNFTAHITDTGASTKILVLNDDITMPEAGTARYKFVHLMPNVAALDLYHGTTLVASNIPYLGNVVFTRPTTAALPDWTIREAGTPSTGVALSTYSSTNTVLNQRGYTVFAIGYKGPTDAVKKPYVSFLLNK
jgi:hypothetical protein